MLTAILLDVQTTTVLHDVRRDEIMRRSGCGEGRGDERRRSENISFAGWWLRRREVGGKTGDETHKSQLLHASKAISRREDFNDEVEEVDDEKKSRWLSRMGGCERVAWMK